jgi:hypothetical protein
VVGGTIGTVTAALVAAAGREWKAIKAEGHKLKAQATKAVRGKAADTKPAAVGNGREKLNLKHKMRRLRPVGRG